MNDVLNYCTQGAIVYNPIRLVKLVQFDSSMNNLDRRVVGFDWVYAKKGFHWVYDYYRGWIEVENEEESIVDQDLDEVKLPEESVIIPSLTREQFKELEHKEIMREWELLQKEVNYEDNGI